MKLRPVWLVSCVCASVTVGAIAFTLYQNHRADELVREAHARLEMSLVAAPDLDRLQISTAISLLKRAEELGRSAPEDVGYLHYAAALEDLQRGDLILADAQVEIAHARLGWTADLHVAAGAIAMRREQLAAAEEHFGEALSIAPHHPRALLYASDIAFDRGHPDQALRLLDTLAHAETSAGCVFNRRGLAREAVGQLDGAREDLRRSARLDPQDPSPMINLGRLLRREGDHVGSLESFRQAIARAPTEPDAHLGAGLALASLGDARGAHAELARAMELAPHDAEPVVALGDLSADVGESAVAIGFYREALAREAGDATSWLKLGNALALARDLRGAADAYHQALRREPNLAAAHNGLGVALMRLGDQAASAELTRAAELDAHDPHPWMNIALLREHAGDRSGARTAWQNALERDPSSAVAQSRLAALP
ncbi:MAG: tetratricopeptide repeat protein [Sandaracinaceae bacterium]|nr:tetratricopeptide repeat protein [Sandaracinaceae bacterium]